MSDEEKVLGNADAPEPTDEPSVDAGLPDRWKGKSPTEIAKAHEELERKLGDQGRELGEYRKSLEQMQSELAYYRQAPPASQRSQTPAPDENFDDKFFSSPTATLKEIMAKDRADFRRELRQEQALRESPRILAELKREEPDIFGDPEVEHNTLRFMNHAVQQGGDPMMLADYQALLAVGLNMKHYKEKQNKPRSPVSPTPTETPSAVRSQEPTKKHVEFNDTEKSFINYFASRVPEVGIKSMKDAAELISEEKD